MPPYICTYTYALVRIVHVGICVRQHYHYHQRNTLSLIDYSIIKKAHYKGRYPLAQPTVYRGTGFSAVLLRA